MIGSVCTLFSRKRGGRTDGFFPYAWVRWISRDKLAPIFYTGYCSAAPRTCRQRVGRRWGIYFREVLVVSIVRIGLAETKHFSQGYDAIFGSKKKKDAKPAASPKAKKKSAKAGKKKGKK